LLDIVESRWIVGSLFRCGLDGHEHLYFWMGVLIPHFLQMSLPPGASRASIISLRPPRFAARLCLRRCRKSCAANTTCVLSSSVSPYADNWLGARHGHFLYERMMKCGLSEGNTRGVMARSRRCTARNGSFMSTVSSGTRRMGQACPSAFTPATLSLLTSSLTRTGELRHALEVRFLRTLHRRAILDRKDRTKTAKTSEDIAVDVGV
jgi:hypothetical protein